MNVACPSCATRYSVDDSRVPPSGVTIKCPKCSHMFVAKKEGAAAPPPPPAAAPSNPVPLPGQAGAVPLPGAQGAVPLPGAQGGVPTSADLGLDMSGLDGDSLDLGLDDDLDLPDLASGRDLPGLSQNSPSGEMLDFLDDNAPTSAATGNPNELHVRRVGGQVDGPYGIGRIQTMLRNGGLSGQEDISHDGVQWIPIGGHPELASFMPSSKTGDALLGLDDDPLPGLDDADAPTSLGDLMDSLDLGDAPVAEPRSTPAPPPPMGMGGEEDLDLDGELHVPEPGSRPRPSGGAGGLEVGDVPKPDPVWKTYRTPILIFGGVIAFILVGVFTQLLTPWGAFGVPGLIAKLTADPPPPPVVAPPPPPAQVADPTQIASLIDEHSFESFRSVFVTIEKAGPDLPDNMLASAKARGFATLSYGTELFPLADLKASVEKLNKVDLAKALGGNAARANIEILKAKSALDLLTGDVDGALAALSGLFEQESNDKEIALLLGHAHLRKEHLKEAESVVNAALAADPKYAPAYHLLGDIVAAGTRPADAAAWYEKALTATAAHSRSAVLAVAIYEATNRQGDRRRVLGVAAPLITRGLPAAERAAFYAKTAEAFDAVGRLGEPAASMAAHAAAKIDPTKEAYVALSVAAAAETKAGKAGIDRASAALKRNPSSAMMLTARARAYMASGDVAKAFLDLEAAKKVNQRDHLVYLWEARFNLELGKFKDARVSLERATRLAGTKSPVPRVELGELDLSLGDVDAAFEAANASVKAHKTDSGAHVLLGKCYERRGQLEKARDTFKLAMEYDVDALAAQLGYANALRDMSLRAKDPTVDPRLQRSIDSYTQVLERAPKNPKVLFEYGRALEILGNVERALELYEQAASFDEKDVRPHLKMVAAQLDKPKPDLKAARKSLKRAQKIEFATGRPVGSVRYWEARTALLENNHHDAVSAMRRAVELEPKNADFQYWMGRSLEANNSLFEAIACYKKAIELNSRLAIAHRALGWTHLERHSFDAARAAFKSFQVAAPDDKTIFADIGETYSRQNLDEEAIRSFKQAVKYEPKNAHALVQIGHILSRRGDERAALKYFLKAARAKPEHGEAWCLIGISKSRNSVSRDAKKALKRCVEASNAPDDLKSNAKEILEAG